MAKRTRRFVVVAAICTAGTVCQFVTSCSQFGLQQLAGGLDFCSILNCTSSSFFSLCDPTITLVDCPGFTP